MNNKISMQFIEALKTKNLDLLVKIPKSDLHNHYCFGGNRDYVYKKTSKLIQVLSHVLQSMEEMHQWVGQNIGELFNSREGRQLAIDACFRQAKDDGITILEVGEDVWTNGHFYQNNIRELIQVFQDAHKKYSADIDFRFQIGLSRHCPIHLLLKWVEPFFEQDCFYSIDLYSDEMAQPIQNFKPIYRMAKEKGLILKAHVGEWGNADSVKEAVDELELDEVQHGISAAGSVNVMNWLADCKIRLNICPTSNVMLGRVDSIEKHPIRKLYDYGVRVTVNSDDVLVFGSSVSREYMELYERKVFTAEELDRIRLEGLK